MSTVKTSDQFKDIENYAKDIGDSDKKLRFDEIQGLADKWKTTGERMAGERVEAAKTAERTAVQDEYKQRATSAGATDVDDLIRTYGERGTQLSEQQKSYDRLGIDDHSALVSGYETRGSDITDLQGDAATAQTDWNTKYGNLQSELQTEKDKYGTGGTHDYAKSQWELQAQKDKVTGLETMYGEGGEKDYAALQNLYGEGGDKDYAALKLQEGLTSQKLDQYLTGGDKDYGAAVQDLKDQQSDFNIKYGDLQGKYGDLKGQYGTLEGEHEGLGKQYGDLQTSYQGVQDKYGTGGTHDYEALQEKYSGVQGEYGLLQGQHKGLQDSYQGVQDKYGKGGTHDYSALQKDYAGLQGEHGYLQGQHTGLQGSYGELRDKYATGGTHDYSALQKDYGTLQGRHGELQGRYEGLSGSQSQPTRAPIVKDDRGVQTTNLGAYSSGGPTSGYSAGTPRPSGAEASPYDYSYDYSRDDSDTKPKSPNLMSDKDRMALLTGK